MANLVRLDKLRGLARLYSDQRPGDNATFIPDADGGIPAVGSLTDLANLALPELYDLLVRAGGEEYYATSATIPIIAGTSLYSLPATFYQLLSLSLGWSASETEEVPRITTPRQRVDLLNGQTWAAWSRKGCRIQGAQIEILPVPRTNLTATLYYIPACPKLTADGDTFDGVNGWERLVALRMAMEMRAIEEAPYNDLERLYDRERQRIESLAAEREAAHPSQIVDVDPEGMGYPLTRTGGRWWP
jgi:hypothetical protein